MNRTAHDRALYISEIAQRHTICAYLEPESGRLRVLNLEDRKARMRYERAALIMPERCLGVYNASATTEMIEDDLLTVTKSKEK